MEITNILEQLKQERDKLSTAIAALEGHETGNSKRGRRPGRKSKVAATVLHLVLRNQDVKSARCQQPRRRGFQNLQKLDGRRLRRLEGIRYKSLCSPLSEERDRIENSIIALEGPGRGRRRVGRKPANGRRGLSAAAKKRISQAAKARWAKAKKGRQKSALIICETPAIYSGVA